MTVVAPASSGSQRTPTMSPAGSVDAPDDERWNVKFVVAPAVGGDDRSGESNATPVPDSVGSSGGRFARPPPGMRTAPARTFAAASPFFRTIERWKPDVGVSVSMTAV